MNKKVVINNYEYEAMIIGTGQPAWLFMHGFMGSMAEYQDVQPKGTRIYLNLLGFGPSAQIVKPAQRFQWREQVNDLNELLNQLNIKKVNLVGYSMGARLALAYATVFPNRISKLVLEGGTAGLATQRLRQQRIIADTKKAADVVKLGMQQFISEWEQLPLFNSQRLLPLVKQKFMHDQRVNQHSENVANSLYFFGTGAMPNFLGQLSFLHVPVTLITGVHDQKFTMINQRMSQQLPQVTWHQISHVGHNVHFEQTGTVTDILNNLATD